MTSRDHDQLSQQRDWVNLYDEKRERYKENIMTTCIIILAALMALDGLALRWGFDSRDDIESVEWPRRQAWKAFH